MLGDVKFKFIQDLIRLGKVRLWWGDDYVAWLQIPRFVAH